MNYFIDCYSTEAKTINHPESLVIRKSFFRLFSCY